MLVAVWTLGAVLLALCGRVSAFSLLEALQAGSENGGRPSDSSSTSHAPHRPPATLTSVGTRNSVLGSLFELGLRDMERQESDEDPPLRVVHKDVDNGSSIPTTSEGARTALLQYLDGIRKDAWAQFRSMALGYVKFLEEEYEDQKTEDRVPLDLIEKMIALGDGASFLHAAGQRVDPELTEYLLGRLQPAISLLDPANSSSILSGSVSSVASGFLRETTLNSLRRFVDHVLRVAEPYVSREELEVYEAELASSVPIAAEGLDLVLNGPRESQGGAGGRSLVNWSRYGDGGYGNDYGGYGHGNVYGGYGAPDDSYGTPAHTYDVYLDPYLVLAGIGAAALLSLLIHKVFMMTKPPPGRRRRSNEGLAFIRLSDVPGVLTMLEDAGDKYDSERSSHQDEVDDLIQGVNSLWRERKNDSGCLRCFVSRFASDHANGGYRLLKGLMLGAVAHLLGAERSGQLVDEVTGLVLEGRPVRCEREANTCTVK